MQINTYRDTNYAVVELKGDLDASSAILLDEEFQTLMEESFSAILVDFQHLNYISSAGLGVFVSYLDKLGQHKKALILFGMSAKVQNVFAILGIDKLLTIATNKEMALAYL
jgi:anti-sigma B factor antagonist